MNRQELEAKIMMIERQSDPRASNAYKKKYGKKLYDLRQELKELKRTL